MSHFEPANDEVVPAVRERRTERRRRVLLTGKLVNPLSGRSADCTIRDISPGGARLAVLPGAVSKDPFLIVVRHALIHESEVAWLNGRQAGLRFLKTFDLHGAEPLPKGSLRRIWLDLLPH